MIGPIPDAGDIVLLDFSPQAGKEIQKRRPALIMSPASFNQAIGLAWVCPITSTPSKHAFQIGLPLGIEGFDYPTDHGSAATVKIEQLRSLDFLARKAKYVASVPQGFLNQCRSIAHRVL